MQPVEVDRAHSLTGSLSNMCDGDLAQRAADGSAAAFRLIMQRNNQRLFRVARSVLGSDDEAEDVVQETYARAAGALHGFRGASSLSTWLTRIALNEAIGRQRRQRQTVEVAKIDEEVCETSSSVVAFPSASPDPETATYRAELRHLLERAIDELPYDFRVVFVMRDVEEFSIQETAEYLNLKPQTVKTRLFRARRLLRELLEDKLETALGDTFACAGQRCARITNNVLLQLGWSASAEET